MEYLPVLVMMCAGMVIGGAVLLITSLLGPQLPNPMKNAPVECGVPPIDPGVNKRMSVRYYVVAILFLLFDVETVFFFPWALVFKKFVGTDFTIFLKMGAFVFVTLVGYFYILRKGALDWE